MVNELICVAVGAGVVGLPCFLRWLSGNRKQKLNEGVKKELQQIIDYCNSTTWHGRLPVNLGPHGDFQRDFQSFGFSWTHLQTTFLLEVRQKPDLEGGHLSLGITISETRADLPSEAQPPQRTCEGLVSVKFHLERLLYDTEELPVTE